MNQLENVVLICRLREILIERNISANKLSNDIIERRSTLNNLINNKEMDKRQIPARLIAKLCFYLNITPSELFEVRSYREIIGDSWGNVAEKDNKGY
jgi:DNA-binding Xre family transcriptional regulator